MRSVKSLWGSLLALPAVSMALMAASPPPRTYDLRFGNDGPVLNAPTTSVIARAPGSSYDLAPTPNRDVAPPSATSTGNNAYLAPTLFGRGQQNRGEGFLSGSSAQADQDRRAMPGAGFNLKMPLQK